MKLLDTTTVALALFFFVLSAVGCVQPNDPTVMSNNKATLAGDEKKSELSLMAASWFVIAYKWVVRMTIGCM